MTKSFGMRVDVKWSDSCPIHKSSETFRNVTEIHYNNYDSLLRELLGPSIAFESDVHGACSTYPFKWVQEMVSVPETEKASEF